MISYYGVNTHFENVIAEKHIRDTQEKKRKQLQQQKKYMANFHQDKPVSLRAVEDK